MIVYDFEYERMNVKSFVYCEWIDDDRLVRALPTARFLGRVRLEDHELAFVSFKEDGADAVFKGGCYLQPVPGAQTPGLLYEFDEAALAEAERLSRVRQGRYRATRVEVVDSAGGRHSAVAY